MNDDGFFAERMGSKITETFPGGFVFWRLRLGFLYSRQIGEDLGFGDSPFVLSRFVDSFDFALGRIGKVSESYLERKMEQPFYLCRAVLLWQFVQCAGRVLFQKQRFIWGVLSGGDSCGVFSRQ